MSTQIEIQINVVGFFFAESQQILHKKNHIIPFVHTHTHTLIHGATRNLVFSKV